jgi:hypothetical protein
MIDIPPIEPRRVAGEEYADMTKDATEELDNIGAEHARRIKHDGQPSFSQWLALMMDDLDNNYDIVICLDSNDANRHGPVGGGKSNLGLILGKCLGPTFSFYEDLVIRDDLFTFKDCVESRRPYKVILVDEAEWFFFLQWWMRRDVKALTPEFMSNRKERRIWILILPLIWDMVAFMRESRIQWRLRIEDRGSATLFMRGPRGFNSEKMDWWGTEVSEFWNIPRVPEEPWHKYEELALGHQCVDEERCVSLAVA